ncbi:MAG: hypothetical protein AAF970_00610 [Bacteroidota bacterium]
MLSMFYPVSGRLSLALLLLFVAAPLYAQPTPSDDEVQARMQAQVEASLERLDLTEAQRPLVRPILEATFAERLAVMKAHGLDPATMNADNRPGRRTLRRLSKDMNRVRKETDAQLREVLTPDQMETWQTLEEERQAQTRAQMRGRG